jgi:serine/threonine-protein kinase HipA
MMSSEMLAVWMDGYRVPAGRLTRSQDGNTSFRYADDYILAGGLPLSLSLPLSDAPFDDVQTRAFFANLLPENAQLQRILDREGLERGDVVGLLHHLGADCAGSVSCLPVGDPRRIPMTSPVDEGRFRADFQNGVLTVTLPKLEGAESRKRIPINQETRH